MNKIYTFLAVEEGLEKINMMVEAPSTAVALERFNSMIKASILLLALAKLWNGYKDQTVGATKKEIEKFITEGTIRFNLYRWGQIPLLAHVYGVWGRDELDAIIDYIKFVAETATEKEIKSLLEYFINLVHDPNNKSMTRLFRLFSSLIKKLSMKKMVDHNGFKFIKLIMIKAHHDLQKYEIRSFEKKADT